MARTLKRIIVLVVMMLTTFVLLFSLFLSDDVLADWPCAPLVAGSMFVLIASGVFLHAHSDG